MSLRAGARFPDSLFTLRLLGLVAGRLLKICVEFPSFSLETNKKARSTFRHPARPLRFPGSCPFLPLSKEYFPWRIWERFYFIRFDRAISKDEGSGCAPNVEKRSRPPGVAGTLAANAGRASPPPGTIRASCASPAGSAVSSALRSDGPNPSPRIWFRTARWSQIPPDYPRLQRRHQARKQEAPAPGWVCGAAAPCGPRCHLRAACLPAEARPTRFLRLPSGFPFLRKDRGHPLPQADLRQLPPGSYV